MGNLWAFGLQEYLPDIFAHLYRSITKRYTRTKPAVVRIGERARPAPGGSPGYIRGDTVHQGDLSGEKGVYHINAVDEVTQWVIVASVEKIAESYLVPVLESMLAGFPSVIRGFHSDNGSEFINKTVAKLLNKLLIRFSKCRPRHTNDNGLVEFKNGSVVRKHLGYAYIPQACAAESYLHPGITIKKLDDIANQMSDNEYAERIVKARSKLFQHVSRWAERVARGYSPSTPPTVPQGKKDSHKKRNRIATSPCSFSD